MYGGATLAEVLCRHGRYQKMLDKTDMDLLYKSASLHDIGKVAISDTILLKTGPLTSKEFAEMKRHTVFGANALERAEEKMATNSFLSLAREIALSHHERWDGTGYPSGLKGEEIPLGGRSMAVADVYDALVSRRPYKQPLPNSRAVKIIMQGDGRTMPCHFDPEVLHAFAGQRDTFRRIAMDFADSEEEKTLLLQ